MGERQNAGTSGMNGASSSSSSERGTGGSKRLARSGLASEALTG